MIATWMLYATLVGLFVSLAAHALDRAARAYRLPTRFIWLGAMIATLVTPWGVYAARAAALRSAKFTEVTVGAAQTLTFGRPQNPSSIASRAFTVVTEAAAKADRPIGYLWALLSLLLLGRLLTATIMLWRRRSQWTSRQIDGVPIYVTPDLGPAVIALPRSRILLPEWLLALDSSQVSTVLRHEREHHLAGDARLLVSTTVMTALLPWNLPLWWQSRRLRLAVELDCDARVLRADPRVDRYGTLLLAIAQHPRATLHAAATLTESTSDLERRIDAMTTPRPSAPRIVAAALSVVAVAAVFAACMTPAPDVVSGPRSRPQEVAAPARRDSMSPRRDTVSYSAPQRIGTDQPMFDFQVEKMATALPTNPVPMYPAQLRVAKIGGIVVAKFVVDTAGRPDMRTFEIVRSDHDLFTNAVRNALPQMRWTPAEVGNRKVKQLIQMPFIFSLGNGGGVLTEAPVSLERRDTTALKHANSNTTTVEFVPVSAGATPQVAGVPVNRSPNYPKQLLAAHIEGQVVAKFVLRPDGTVDMGTFEIVKTDHDLFSKAVKDAVASYRLPPAMVNGVAVSKLMTMPFVFSLSK